MRVVAIDPGDRYHGVAEAIIRDTGSIEIMHVWEETERFQLVDDLFDIAPAMLVVEEYRLYPWQARQQGFSNFPTPRLIGALEYAAHKHNVDVVFQKAATKKHARTLATDQGWQMADRELGSGKGKYRGPDFDAAWLKKDYGCKSSQHVRDALAHLVYFAYTNPASPARLTNSTIA